MKKEREGNRGSKREKGIKGLKGRLPLERTSSLGKTQKSQTKIFRKFEE